MSGIWENYGLKGNPFEITPVEANGLISMDTFSGRTKEIEALDRIIKSRDRSLTLIIGQPGVGKTSLVNYYRFQNREDYFSPVQEIDCQPNWTTGDLIENLLYATYDYVSKVEEAHTKKKLTPILDQLKPLFEVNEKSEGFQVAGFGLNWGGSRSFTRVPHMFLKNKLAEISKIAKNSGFGGGVIFHLNNLENCALEDEDGLKKMLSGLRDTLQIPHCHFIFLCNQNAADCFTSDPKVQSIISDNIPVLPFGVSEIKKIINKRFEAYRIAGLSITRPCNEDAIVFATELHDGNIRDILTALSHAVTSIDRGIKKDIELGRPLLKKVLKESAEQRLTTLSKREREVLSLIITKNEITTSGIAKALALQQTNTSTYLRDLREKQFIAVSRTEGKNKFYTPYNRAKWLAITLEANGI